jgi:glycosyltransferase involved in cell wall biosynthesis
MTVYNASLYVEASIRSILQQTFPDFELIIIDDGSTDGSRIILESIHDARIKLYYHEHHGRAHALNEGLKHVHTPFVAFMDADDVAVPERIEKQYLCLQQNLGIGVVSGWYTLIDSSGMEMNMLRKVPANHKEIEYEMTIHSSMCFPATMLRRELFDVIGGYNETCQSAIDYEFFLRLLPVTNFYNLQKILLYYRIHINAISTGRKNEQRINTLNLANEYLFGLLERATMSNERRKIYYRLGLNEYYHGTMCTARRWFLQALPKCWTQWRMWRYILPTLLGDTIFRKYRKIHNRI